jgi:myosin heavy subunit
MVQQIKINKAQIIARQLLQIVNSVYRDKADAIVGVPKIAENGSMSFKFRDAGDLYDCEIVGNKISYIESSGRKDSYLAGFLFHSQIPTGDNHYAQSLVQTTLKRTDSKTRKCQRGKPCGGTCIAKGLMCQASLSVKQEQQVFNIRRELMNRQNQQLALVGTAALVTGAGLAAVAYQTKSKQTVREAKNAAEKKEEEIGRKYEQKAEDQKNDLIKKKDRLSTQLKNKKAAFDKQSAELESIKKELASKSNEHAASKKILEAIQPKLQDLQKSIVDIRKENTSLKRENAKLTTARDKLIETNQQLKDQTKSPTKKELQQAKSSLEASEKEKAELEITNQEQLTQLESLSQQIKESEAKVNESDQKISGLEQQLKTATTQKNKAEAEVNKLGESVRNVNQRLQQSNQTQSRLEAELKQSQKQLADFQANFDQELSRRQRILQREKDAEIKSINESSAQEIQQRTSEIANEYEQKLNQERASILDQAEQDSFPKPQKGFNKRNLIFDLDKGIHLRSSIRNGVDFESMNPEQQQRLVESSANKMADAYSLDAKNQFLQTTRNQISNVLDSTDRPDVVLSPQTRNKAIEEILGNRGNVSEESRVIGNSRGVLNQLVNRLAGIEEALQQQSLKESQFDQEFQAYRQKSLQSYQNILQQLIASKPSNSGFELGDLVNFDSQSKRIAQQMKTDTRKLINKIDK